MVSANLKGIANQYDDMVADRDVTGFVALAGVGALGGLLAEMFHARVAPRLNQPTTPSSSGELVGSFGIKAMAAVLLMVAAMKMDGTAALVLSVLGVGATIDAGVDLLEAGDTFRDSGTSTAGPSRQVRQAVPSQPRRASSSNGQPKRASAQIGSSGGRQQDLLSMY